MFHFLGSLRDVGCMEPGKSLELVGGYDSKQVFHNGYVSL